MVFGGGDFEVSRSPLAASVLQAIAKKAVTDAASTSKTLREFTARVKNAFEAANGMGWHVLAGSDFAVDLRYRKGACILLSSKKSKMKVLLYRTTPALTPALPSEEALEPMTEDEVAVPKRKVVWFECEMEPEMKADVLCFVNAQLQSATMASETDPDEDAALSMALKRYMSVQYGHTWHCIVSKSRELCSLSYHDQGTRGDFSIGQYRIVLYRHNGSPVDTQVDMSRMALRVVLVIAAMFFVMYGYFAVMTTEMHSKCGYVAPEDEDPTEVTAQAMAALAECSEDEIARAQAHNTWKSATFFAMVIFIVTASFIRVYRRSLRQKLKHV